MSRRSSRRAELHYYSEAVRQKFGDLPLNAVTIIEAPSGYGKTTAVQDFLGAKISRNIPVYWFTAMEEASEAGFRRLCGEIHKIDSHAGGRLLKTGVPNAATIGEACEALRSIRCRQETYLVIDNLHLLQTALPPPLFTALMDHGGEGLHVVMITQMLGRDLYASVAGRGFLHISASDLRLDAGNIQSYYDLSGVEISEEEARKVESCTEGWMIAVYLQLQAFRKKNDYSDETVLSLMEHLVWDAMTGEQQDFLLRLSPFESITHRQICALVGSEELPVAARQALKNPFIRHERPGQRYELHAILAQLLRQKLSEKGKAREHTCLMRAGDLFRDEGRLAEAMGFYWRIKNYGRMLSLDFSSLILDDLGDTPFYLIAMDIVENCPPDTMKAYPLSMLRIAWTLLSFSFHDPFRKLMKGLREMIWAEDGEDRRTLRGEWLLLSSFGRYPELEEMITRLEKAREEFNGECSQVVLPESPWWFGSCGPLGDFHFIPGRADGEGEILEKYVGLLSGLTNGYGSGADTLYHAQLAYHRGNMKEAEMLAYKAVFLAEGRRQGIVQLGATLQLAQVALYNADTQRWRQAINAMERAASYPSRNTFVLRSALDIMRGILLAELQQLDGIAGWLRKGDFSRQHLLPQMLPLALLVHGLYLLLRGEVPRMIGVIEARLPEGGLKMPVNYMLVTLNMAAGYVSMGNREKAVSLVRSAAQAVMPDGIVFNFASFSWLLNGITDELVRKEYPEHFDRMMEVKEFFGLGWNRLYHDILPKNLPDDLTEREREVALLAAEGSRNNEIAEKLCISESTVRTHMRSIFKKLDIDRRVKLAEKLKSYR